MDTGCPGLGTIPPLTIASEQLVYIFCLSNGRYTDFAIKVNENENVLHLPFNINRLV